MATSLTTIRDALRDGLGDRCQAVIDGYRQFADQPAPDDAKTFAAHHGACKAALAHLDLLVKLARWAEAGDAATDPQADLLAEARAALAGEEEDDDA